MTLKKKAVVFYLLVFCLSLIIPNGIVAQSGQWVEFEERHDVPLDKEWTITFSGEVDFADIDGIVIRKGNEFIPVSIELKTQNQVAVIPVNPFAENSRYCLKIFLNNLNRYRMYFNTTAAPLEPEHPTIDLSSDVFLKVEAKPEKGFYWDYYLFIPRTVLDNSNRHLLVEPNNTGTVSDDIAVHDESAERLLKHSHANDIARKLNVPLLVPVFPRPRTDWQIYTHALDEDTLLVKDGPLKRIDLQLIAMIEDAQGLLASNDIEVAEKVFMHGFSASGVFLTSFSLLHPHIIRAFAAGGVGGHPTLPIAEWHGERLNFPVGIADLKEITGIEFDIEQHRQISQFIYMGYLDKNDATLFRDSYTLEDAELIWRVLGKDIMQRWQESQSVFEFKNIPVQFVTYNATTHTIRREMLEDIVEFFKANTGTGIVKIETHQYAYVPYQELEAVHIKEAHWAGTEGGPQLVKTLPVTQFVICIEEWIEQQDFEQLGAFLRNLPLASRKFILKAPGHPDISAELTAGTFVDRLPGVYYWQGFVLELSDLELAKMQPNVPYTIHPVKASDIYYFTVREGVTITRP